MRNHVRPASRRWRVAAALAAAAVLLAACASKTNTPAASTTTAAGGAVTVTAHSGPLGTYLTDGNGRTLYLFAADTSSTSTCTGACATYWPPLTTTGSPAAGSGVQGAMLSTSKRSDGSTQVVYNGHPLYYYASDKAAGDTTGQGLNLSGGLWWIVAPSGDAIQGAAPSPSSGGGGGGWA